MMKLEETKGDEVLLGKSSPVRFVFMKMEGVTSLDVNGNYTKCKCAEER
jgi:hypothetical protein